jgi:S-DNA-T family DNA segregation ATPase FtsK/SpoIIIE
MQKTAAESRLAKFGALLNPMRLDHTWQREVFAVAAFGLAAFWITAVLSFDPNDATLVSASWPEKPVANLAGAIGSRIAGLSIFLLGIVAVFAPMPLVAAAISLLRRSDRPFPFTKAFGWILLLTLVTAVAAHSVPHVKIHDFHLPSGGAVGEFIAATLLKYLGKVGAMIATTCLLICAIIMVFERSLLTPMSRWAAARLKSMIKIEKIKELNQPLPAAKPSQEALLTFDTNRHEPSVGPVNLVAWNHGTEATPAETPAASELVLVDDSARNKTAAQHMPRVERVSMPIEPTRPENVMDSLEKPTTKNKPSYIAPPVSIFQTAQSASTSSSFNTRELEATSQLLTKTFADFGVEGKVIGWQPGPVVTVFEFQPDAGVKQSKIVGLIDDIALTLKVDSIFIHPVPGKRALGIQVPNAKRETVYLGDVIGTSEFANAPSPLTFGMGKSISGQPILADLTSMPHLLMAGATGAGKSVAINALLCSIVMKASPDDVRLILVDPKMLELSVYEGIPHLLMPVITEPTRASMALKWAASEMERRYKMMQHAHVRNISGFNSFWAQASEDRRNEIREVMGDDSIEKLPYILLVIDELADLMLTAPKDVESSIQRLAQKARASGIHMVLATQRPSVDIITGVIKANLPCRISFQVVSKHDSRTILDQVGSEKLLGRGDMLFQRPGIGRLERIQGALISDEEVLNLVANAKASGSAEYDESIMSWIDEEVARAASMDEGSSPDLEAMDDDPKYDEAVTIAKTHGVVSASFLQRHLKIGYNRAARIVEFMEAKGYVAKAEGAKPRKWLGPAA